MLIISSQGFEESLKKLLYCTGLLIPCLPCVNLDYSTIILASHVQPKTFFTCCCCHVSSCKNTVFSTSKLKDFVYKLAHVRKYPCWQNFLGWCNYTEKNHPRATGFLICKSEIIFVKNIPPSRDGTISTCNKKCYF